MGLVPGTTLDAIQFRSCCGDFAHADILAVAAIPEPGAFVCALAGLVGLGAVAWRRRRGAEIR
jgi:hypothetical protein